METVMKFALVNNIRCEASPKLAGQCPACLAEMVAKCGTKRIWHWSHRGERSCDLWWETETAWHRAWKNLFPRDWQEVGHVSHSGERHTADIKTKLGLVIEIQHSAIAEIEMDARETFYKQMVWVVDATRLKRDLPRLENGIRTNLKPIGAGYFITATPEECFPAAWLHRKAPVLFDYEAIAGFREGKPAENSRLWFLLPNRVSGYAVAALVSRRQFAEIAHQRATIFPCEQIMQVVAEAMELRRRAVLRTPLLPPRPRGHRVWRRRTARF
jgi:competence protein CoiA